MPAGGNGLPDAVEAVDPYAALAPDLQQVGALAGQAADAFSAAFERALEGVDLSRTLLVPGFPLPGS